MRIKLLLTTHKWRAVKGNLSWYKQILDLEASICHYRDSSFKHINYSRSLDYFFVPGMPTIEILTNETAPFDAMPASPFAVSWVL